MNPLLAAVLLPFLCPPKDPDPAPAEARNPPLILLISLDTLRADRLHCYGGVRPLSPNLDALAEQATLFEVARSTAPWTLPSHASLFTGLYPFEHGAHTFREGEDERLDVSLLQERHRTLAEELAGQGYDNGAVCANVAYLTPGYNMDQGFAHFVSKRGRGTAINRRALEWLDQARRPAFLFLNYMDTHRPYNCAPRPGILARPVPQDSADRMRSLYPRVLGGEPPPPGEDLVILQDQYDLAVANLDAILGELFQQLRDRDLFDPALIIVTSDHGEFFGEHDLLEHSKDIYEPVLRIPLLVKAPGQQHGIRESRPVSLVHVPRMIFETLKGPLGPSSFQYAFPEPTLLVENYFSRRRDLNGPWAQRFNRVRTVWYRGTTKLIHSSDGQHELYDLSADPAELHNHFAADDPRSQQLEQELRAFLADRSRGDHHGVEDSLTPEELQQLEELGYR